MMLLKIIASHKMGKMFPIDTADKELLPKIYRQHLNSTIGKWTMWLKNWQRIWIESSLRKS